MFGSNKKTAELEHRISDYHAALQRIAQHIGVTAQLPPDQLAGAICSAIDARGDKEPPMVFAPGSESRLIPSNIRKIKLSGAVDVELRQGPEAKMEVFANNASDLPKIITTVSGDSLTVDNEPMMIVSGGRGVTQIISGNANTQIAGGGLIVGRNFGTVIGKANFMDQRTSAPGFRVEVTLPNVASLRISGAGNIKATATASVVARVSGVGKIKIGGNPPQRDTDVSGMGKIKFVDLATAPRSSFQYGL